MGERQHKCPRDGLKMRESCCGLDPSLPGPFFFKFFFYLFMIVSERKREAETQAEGEAGSMRRELDPGSPGSRPGPKAGAKLLRHPGIPVALFKVFASAQ